MSWTNLFKKTKTKPDPRIRWFGKLPSYPDYYSSPADEDWAIEFNEFVLKGFEVYRSRLSGANKKVLRLPVSGCVIRLPKSEMTVFATILDFGGDMRGRPFPMCFYAGVPSSMWPGPTSERLSGATRAIRDLLALRRTVASFLNSPGRFEAAFGDRVVDLDGIDEESTDGSWSAAGKSISFADWFSGAEEGLKVKDCDEWVRLVRTWGRNLAKLDGKSFEPTLRFPLAMRHPIDVQIAGWIRWLELRIDLKRRLLSLMVSGDAEDHHAGLTVIAHEVVPEDFLLLAPTATRVPYLDDLAEVAELESAEGSGEDFRTSVSENWVDFVEEPVG